jgi:predicted Zn-dependent protease
MTFQFIPPLFLSGALAFGQSADLEKERALGRNLANEVRRQAVMVEDPFLTGYVNRLAQKVTAACPSETLAGVEVIRSDEVNAFALPGGFLFVNTGLIRRASGEAALAAVLAHVAARLRTHRPYWRSGNASIPLIFMDGPSGYAYGPKAGALGIPMAFREQYRAAVSAADRSGVECLARAGYDPREFIENLRALPAAPASASTYPSPAERIQQVQTAIDALGRQSDSIVDTAEFVEMRLRAERAGPAVRPAPSLLK